MNILPHKSWHVRTKKNIERVRRDEENAAAEEKERQRKIALAEQEARTDLLRQKAKKRLRNGEEESNPVGYVEDNGESSEAVQVVEEKRMRHINFFSEVEDGKKTSGTNKEHEAEKKAEQEKLEMSIGLLTYLGQGSAESQTVKPWYLRGSEKDKEAEIGKTMKERKKKDFLDPMNQMMEYVCKKKKSSKEKHKHEREKRHKHAKKEGHSSKTVTSSQPSKTIEQLRAERTRREAEEKLRTQQLLAKLRGEPLPEDTAAQAETDSRSRRYNSQYNPELVRQPKERHNEPKYSDSRSSQSRHFDSRHSESRHSDSRHSDWYKDNHVSDYSRHRKPSRGKYH